MRKIKILKDTPFNKEGDIIDVKEFREKYTYICTRSTSDEDLLKYLLREHSHYVLHPHEKAMGQWFTTTEEAEEFTESNLPLSFIYEGLYYTKEMDGLFHIWTNPAQRALREDAIYKILPKQVEQILKNAQYKQEILYCTNYVNKKL